MAQSWKSWGGQFGIVRALVMGGAITLAGGFANTLSENRALAQITPDATLGAEHSAVTSNAKVRGLPAELIEGGAMRGANLFHSFQEFNVGNGQRVYFANPAGDVNLTTGKLIIQDGAEVTTAAVVTPSTTVTLDTLGSGNAGNIQRGGRGDAERGRRGESPLDV